MLNSVHCVHDLVLNVFQSFQGVGSRSLAGRLTLNNKNFDRFILVRNPKNGKMHAWLYTETNEMKDIFSLLLIFASYP